MNTLPDTLQDRHVLVLGLGASGLALARWCAGQGARVTVADTRAQPPCAAQLAQDVPGASLWCAPFDAALFAWAPWALVCRSPGIAPAQLAPLQAAAQAAGVPLVGELGLFAQALQGLREPGAHGAAYRPQVLAITGTNGKTTTTALTAHLLRAAGWSVAVAGNIGPTLLDVLGQHLHAHSLPQAWVLELSSFQLDGVQNFEPTAATVLNVTQDHLDWHGSMQAYAQAKSNIFGQQGALVLNRDDATVMALQPPSTPSASGGLVQGRVRARAATALQAARACCTFGVGLPTQAGDWGLETVNGMAWLVRAQALDDGTLSMQRLMPAEALRIRGRHNACNALAALALATAAGAPLAPMLHGLRDYRGEPHRAEPVAIVGGVEYVDDSKGTNVGATLAALQGLGAERRLVVILGGDGKGQDFTPLAAAVAAHVRAVALIGRDAAHIAQVLRPTAVPLQLCADLPSAVRWCAQQAQEGDVVLLSPACASLDMFRDYAHRAQVFVDTVQALQAEEGTPT